jgi:S1-C subfamily serine protease
MRQAIGLVMLSLFIFGSLCPAFAEESDGKERITIIFSDKNPLMKKTYFVRATHDVRGIKGVDADSGSGFVFQSDNAVYFITAAHVVAKGSDDFLGERREFFFRDYAGTIFAVTPLFSAWNLDLAVFTVSEEAKKYIRPETLTHAIASATIEEKISTCGFDINNGLPLFPACLPSTIKAKISHLDLNHSGFDFTINNIIAVSPGLEYGFSGGPVFNEKEELVAVNIATSRGGRFGYLESALVIKEIIKKYNEIQKNELGESPPVNFNKKKAGPLL